MLPIEFFGTRQRVILFSTCCVAHCICNNSIKHSHLLKFYASNLARKVQCEWVKYLTVYYQKILNNFSSSYIVEMEANLTSQPLKNVKKLPNSQ